MAHSPKSRAALIVLAGAGSIIAGLLNGARAPLTGAPIAAIPVQAAVPERGIQIILFNPLEDSATVFAILDDLAAAAPRKAPQS